MDDFLQLIWTGRQACKPAYRVGPYPRNCCILHYILEGRGKVRAHGVEMTVKAGQMFAIWKGESLVYGADEQAPWTYVWVDFDGEAAYELLAQTGFSRTARVSPALERQIFEPLFERLHAANASRLPHEGCAALLALFSALIRAFPADRAPRLKTAERAAAMLRAGFSDPNLRIDAIAKAEHLSRSQLYRLFYGEYGVSPKSYLRTLRLSLARRLLQEHALSVAEVAASCGYTDPLYFSADFKREYGDSPKAFAKKLP